MSDWDLWIKMQAAFRTWEEYNEVLDQYSPEKKEAALLAFTVAKWHPENKRNRGQGTAVICLTHGGKDKCAKNHKKCTCPLLKDNICGNVKSLWAQHDTHFMFGNKCKVEETADVIYKKIKKIYEEERDNK